MTPNQQIQIQELARTLQSALASGTNRDVIYAYAAYLAALERTEDWRLHDLISKIRCEVKYLAA